VEEDREGDGDGEKRKDAEPRLLGDGLAALLTLPGNRIIGGVWVIHLAGA